MNKIAKFAVLLLLPLAARGAPVMPYGTYLVKGAFKGEYNTVLRDFGTAAVRAQRADGTVIAESTVATADAEGFNFILSIPVASQTTPKACVVGETLDCVFAAEGETLAVPAALKVGPPISVGVLAFNCTEVAGYTNAADGAVAEIPTSYLAEAQAFLDDAMPGETYDPWGDYDHDGASNYAEFLAGTIPFDASDFLRITGFEAGEERQLALSFEHVGGHVYAVLTSPALVEPEWAAGRVRKTAGGAELDQVLADGSDGEPGETVVYITPVAGAASGFFALEAK
jgi:hypothetical protein